MYGSNNLSHSITVQRFGMLHNVHVGKALCDIPKASRKGEYSHHPTPKGIKQNIAANGHQSPVVEVHADAKVGVQSHSVYLAELLFCGPEFSLISLPLYFVFILSAFRLLRYSAFGLT